MHSHRWEECGGRTIDPNIGGLGIYEKWVQCSLRTVVSTLLAYWNCLSHLKNIGSWVLPHRNSDAVSLGCELGIGIFKSSYGDSDVQP